MKPCLFGLSRPSLEVWKKIKNGVMDNFYTCVALRAAGKNGGTLSWESFQLSRKVQHDLSCPRMVTGRVQVWDQANATFACPQNLMIVGLR